MNNHRDWSSLRTDVIRAMSDNLNAIDHVSFRSVCSTWRAKTNQRQKAPLLILFEGAQDRISSVSFFDMIRQEIIPASSTWLMNRIRGSYCGSSHGWLFITYKFTAGEQMISLVNPFSPHALVPLPVLNRGERGLVLLSHSPPDFQNNISTVVYYTAGNPNIGAQVSFLRVGQKKWTTFTFQPFLNPDDVIASNGRFYANYKGVLFEIDLENHSLLNDQRHILPGMHPDARSDGLLNLRFLQDVHGGLHLVCSSWFPRTYFILKVYVGEMGTVNEHTFDPPVIFDSVIPPRRTASRYYNPTNLLMILQGLTGGRILGTSGKYVMELSSFFKDPQFIGKAVGWITPDLRVLCFTEIFTEMNKKFKVYDNQQDKVKDRAKFTAAKEAAKGKGKGKGKTDGDDEIPPEAPKKWRDYYSAELHFPEPTELTPPLLQLIDASFSYPGREDFKLAELNLGIDMGTRVAIVGPNGAGKSTLLNLIAGDLSPNEGEVRRSQKLRIGRYSQHFVDLLTMDETPVEYLLRLHPNQIGLSKQEAVRAKLGKFGLPSHNHLTPIVKLSGGQKARVVFTSISMSNPHILLLDEPTNHLDMQSIDALADALDEFTGGVVLVSHDSRLISRVCENEENSEIWEVNEGTVRKFPGSFEEYKDELLDIIKTEVDD